MPEYFFHIRLDIVGRKGPHSGDSTGSRISSSGNSNNKTNIFSTPPRIGGDTVRSGVEQSGGGGDLSRERTTTDWRGGKVRIQGFDMLPVTSGRADSASGSGMAAASAGASSQAPSLNKRLPAPSDSTFTKARFEPSESLDTDVGWGVVRLFRDIRETPGLDDAYYSNKSTRVHTPLPEPSERHDVVREEDCTTLCILAVPSEISPTRFLTWAGDKTREDVSHFRMLKTEEASRYMVLMRFRNGKRARQWRKEWNGAYFDNASPETAKVVFVKSIELMPNEDAKTGASFPDMQDDPLTGAAALAAAAAAAASRSRGAPAALAALGSKPLPPPTPSLVEMPTCPVCLERMDESSGLLTILCQHVFHCSCLYKWRGTGCPVCRFTHSGLSGKTLRAGPDEDNESGPNECNICHSEDNLWICLICGNIGCGRYDAAHAYLHWQQSGHAFSMDMATQRIWDYQGDAYVHRIVQNKLDGKISEAPAEEEEGEVDGGEFTSDYIPREKSDAIGREYTALLTSQLESQRAYFEEKIGLLADKTGDASTAAMEATKSCSRALAELSKLRDEHVLLTEQTVPALERERDRAAKRADKAQEMARKFEKEWRTEKSMGEGLHERIKALDEELSTLRLENRKAKEENAEQAEMVRDLQFFISGQEKIKELGEEVAEGDVSLPERKQTPGRRGRKGKGKTKEEGGGG